MCTFTRTGSQDHQASAPPLLYLGREAILAATYFQAVVGWVAPLVQAVRWARVIRCLEVVTGEFGSVVCVDGSYDTAVLEFLERALPCDERMSFYGVRTLPAVSTACGCGSATFRLDRLRKGRILYRSE